MSNAHNVIGRFKAGLLVLILVVAGGLATPAGEASAASATQSSTPGSTDAWGAPCGKIFVIGVRGSGASWDSNEGLGPLTWSVVNQARQMGARINVAALPYQAVSIEHVGVQALLGNSNRYVESQRHGVNMLTNLATKRVEKCPAEKLFLIGHSQGAHVISDFLRYRASRTLKARIAGYALFADPSFDPRHPGAIGGFNRNQRGIFNNPQRWSGVNGITVCVAGDPVCQWSVRNLRHMSRHSNGYGVEMRATARHLTKISR